MVQEAKKQKHNHIADYFLRRVYKQNNNNLAVFTGSVGKGKSFAALRFAELLTNPSYGVCTELKKIYIVFTAKEFTRLIQSKIMNKGDCCVWDEVGVNFSSRLFWSTVNIAVNFILQTFREGNNITVLMTSPDMSFIDVAGRKLLNFNFEMQRVDKRNKISIAKPFLIDVRRRENKIYYKYLMHPLRNNVKLHKIKFKLPSKELLKQYEEKKTPYQSYIQEKMNEGVRKMDELGKKKPDKMEVEIYQKSKKGIQQKELANKHNLSEMQVSRLITKCKKYFLED